MGIEVVVFLFEVDKEIVVIVNDKYCFVLLQDVDFYVLLIIVGFFFIDYFRMKMERKYGKEMSKFLKCKIYYFEKFIFLFFRFGQKVFLFFVIFFGNDYMDKEDF